MEGKSDTNMLDLVSTEGLQMQDFAYVPLQYPHVLGSDVAGEVVKIGSGVTRFQTGDRVMG